MLGSGSIILFTGFCALLAILVLLAVKTKKVKAKQALMQVVLVLVLLGILVFIEMFSLFKVYKRWDLTETRRYTFSSLTINLLTSLESPLQATAFVQTSQSRGRFEQLLSNAHYYNPAQVQYEFADPERDFIKAAKFPQPVEPPVLFLQYEGKTERVTEFSEEALAQALSKLVKSEVKTVYLLQGHGELGLDRAQGKPGRSLTYLEDLLDGQNKKLELFEIDPEQMQVPEDADVLLIAGPEVDFTSSEYSALDRYLVEGGQLIVLLDNGKAPGVASWLSKYGFHLPDDLVIEMEQNYALTPEGLQPQITLNLAVGIYLREHEMNQELSEKRIFAVESRSVGLAAALPKGVTGEILADSAQNAWAELHPEYGNLEEAQFEEGVEQEGPVPLGAMISGDFAKALGISSATESSKGSLIVFGDGDFPSDRTYGRSYGVNLLSNMINYLTQDTEMISIPPKTKSDAPYVRMTAARWGQLLLVSFVILPGVIFVIGMTIFIRRRKNG